MPPHQVQRALGRKHADALAIARQLHGDFLRAALVGDGQVDQPNRFFRRRRMMRSVFFLPMFALAFN